MYVTEMIANLFLFISMFQRYETVENAMAPNHKQFEKCEITITPGLPVLVKMRAAKYN